MQEQRRKVRETVGFILDNVKVPPEIGILTGTGLQHAAASLETDVSFSYHDLPHFPVSTVESHPGIMSYGRIADKPAIVMKGRLHLYEGFSARDISFPVRVLQELGVNRLIVTNAAGGLNPEFRPGDIMVITDHINLTGATPLSGPNEEAWGLRFPDMAGAYDSGLSGMAQAAGAHYGVTLRQGVYAGLKGPSLETPAETRFLRMIQADAVGFSTVCEVIAACHGGLRTLGLSIISNVNDPDNPLPVTLEAVVETAGKAASTLDDIIQHVIGHMDDLQ